MTQAKTPSLASLLQTSSVDNLMLANVYRNRAKSYTALGKTNEAARDYEEYASLSKFIRSILQSLNKRFDKNSADDFHDRGKIELALNDYKAALADFETSAKMEPSVCCADHIADCKKGIAAKQ